LNAQSAVDRLLHRRRLALLYSVHKYGPDSGREKRVSVPSRGHEDAVLWQRRAGSVCCLLIDSIDIYSRDFIPSVSPGADLSLRKAGDAAPKISTSGSHRSLSRLFPCEKCTRLTVEGRNPQKGQKKHLSIIEPSSGGSGLMCMAPETGHATPGSCMPVSRDCYRFIQSLSVLVWRFLQILCVFFVCKPLP
jgi:hypothetical protein